MADSNFSKTVGILALLLAIPGTILAIFSLLNSDQMPLEHQSFVEVHTSANDADLLYKRGFLVSVRISGGGWAEVYTSMQGFLRLTKDGRSYLLVSLGGDFNVAKDVTELPESQRLLLEIEFHERFDRPYKAYSDSVETRSLNGEDVDLLRFYVLNVRYKDRRSVEHVEYHFVVGGHTEKLEKDEGERLWNWYKNNHYACAYDVHAMGFDLSDKKFSRCVTESFKLTAITG